MKLYFDMCALKRPFDDRSQPRVDAEAEAVLDLLQRIIGGGHTLVWSVALEYENRADPDLEVREVIGRWAGLAAEQLRMSPAARQRAAQLHGFGFSPLDAVHLALAEVGACDVLVTCDDRLQKRAARVSTSVRVANPLELAQEQHDG